jgi:hypothetical protein
LWGLFSTTPGLIRVPSEHYEDAVWCLRERQLFDYLRDEDDFLDGRYLIELPQAHLGDLDAVIPAKEGDDGGTRLFKVGQFRHDHGSLGREVASRCCRPRWPPARRTTSPGSGVVCLRDGDQRRRTRVPAGARTGGP